MDSKVADKMDWVPGGLAMFVTLLVALSQLTPYVRLIPGDNLNLITQQQTTLMNGWLMILTYYFATSSNASKAQATIAMQAETARQAGATLAAVATQAAPPPSDVTLKPGDEVTVAAATAGPVDVRSPPAGTTGDEP